MKKLFTSLIMLSFMVSSSNANQDRNFIPTQVPSIGIENKCFPTQELKENFFDIVGAEIVGTIQISSTIVFNLWDSRNSWFFYQQGTNGISCYLNHGFKDVQDIEKHKK